MRNHLRALQEHFAGRGYAVHLAAPGGDSPAATDEKALLSGGGRVSLPLEARLSPARDLRSFWRLYRALQRIRPSFVHIHGFKAALVGLPAAGLARLPALVTVHNYPAERGRSLLPAALRAAGREGVRYIAVSRALARTLENWGIPPERIAVIYNGIDPAPFAAAAARRRFFASPGKLVVGTAARLAPQKGLPYFIRAAARLALQFPDMRFRVVGEGPERPVLEKLARRLGLETRLSFPGYRADLPDCLAQMDIFVLPSLTEGLAITLLEAMAAGCPVVATRVGGVPEVIADGATGRLIPPGDDAALAAAVAALARDPEQAARLAAAARVQVGRRFTLQRMLTETEAIYSALLADKAIAP